MAYKQTPGRGNHPKTGHGLPSPLKQGIELTEKYTKGVKTLKKKREEGNTDTGLNIDKATGIATAKPYEKSFVPSTSKSQQAHIVGVDKKTVASASTYGGGAEKLRREFTSDSASTMNRRNRSAELYNATSGGTKSENLSGNQIASLVNIGKAKRTR